MTTRNFLLLSGILFLTLAAPSRAALFFIDTNIGPADTNYDGQDIIVVGCTVTIDGAHNFSDLVVIENGEVTHSPITTNLPDGLELSISNNLIVEAGSAMDVQGLGFGPGLGAGAGTSIEATNTQNGFFFLSGGGGAFGGNGGSSFGGAAGGGAYGLPVAPTNAGSGGGAGFGNGGSGGGVINLAIGGALVVDGTISAGGGNGVNLASGGGSGGSINISVPSISGNGSILALGGTSEGFDGGGGGGGRIALALTINDFTGTVSAAGGQGAVAGGAGTVELRLGTGIYQILVDNAGLSGTNTPLPIPSGSSVSITGGAVAYFPVPLTLSDLDIGSNSFLVADTPMSSTFALVVRSNATIQAGGGINYDRSAAVTETGNGSIYRTNGLAFGGGGGFGGNGGGGFNAAGGASFGTYPTPASVGGAGGEGSSGNDSVNPGGAGGGAFSFMVARTLTLNGSISANGGAGFGEGSGGGAGGSISLTVGALAGDGLIAANGGAAGSDEGGGGAGGRVAVYGTAQHFTGSISAHGGVGFVNGGAGTIYLKSTNSPPAKLLLDNGGLAGAATPTYVPEETLDLIVTNAAAGALDTENMLHSLTVASNSYILALKPTTVISVLSNATIQAGGSIIVNGKSLENSENVGNGGGGYGGAGGSGSTGPGGPAEGSVSLEQPSPGWPGGGEFQTGGGAGGGALSISSGGSLVVNGLISANGAAGVAGTGSGGGSGGSIYLAANEFLGSGSIRANGGTGDSLVGGGGGGGRISISSASNSFAGTVTAFGGDGFVAGGAGTIYVANRGTGIGQVIVDNGGLIGTNTPISELPLVDLNLAGGAVIAFSGFDNEIRNLLIASNSFIIVPHPIQESSGLRLQLSGNATIQTGSGIIADGAGFAGGLGADAGSSSTSNSITTGGGGGNVGYGGNSALGAKGGGALSPPPPNDAGLPAMGGGGGAGSGQSPQNLGGAGGGSLLLVVEGSLELEGILSANGAPGLAEGSGGGAGGGIFVEARSFSGHGIISASGGAGNVPYGGGGGGGIIDILINATNLFAGSSYAHGGMGATSGGAGMVMEDSLPDGEIWQVMVDNAGLSGTNTTPPNLEEPYDISIIDGAILGLNGNSSLNGEARNLLLGSNSFIMSSSGVMTLNVASNLTILPSGGLVVDGRGTPGGGDGPGTGRTFGSNGGGGGYGGSGGAGAGGAAGGPSYGSVVQPASLGSGGGGELGFGAHRNSGGAGGGELQIRVGATLSMDGAISANGGAGQSPGGGGGGSGGSIELTIGALTGTGSITANGGAGQLPGGGGGGGGRIAVIGSASQFAGVVSAHGGAGFANGGAGTIYNSLANGLQSQITVDNAGLSNAATSLASVESASNLTIRAGAVVTSPPKLTGNLLIASSGILLPTNAPLSVQGNATVQAGGSILLNGSGPATGSGTGTNASSPGGFIAGSGGGHGGYGGASSTKASGGNAYDLFNAPTGSGSGGGPGVVSALPGARGGGALQFTVTGTLQVDGLISANGADASGEGGGGGSGGSLFLTAGVISGTGVISAKGGVGDLPNGGGGGGGRIALLFTNDLFTGLCQAGGGLGFVAGGAGTIYFGSQNQTSMGASNQLIIDNDGLTGAATPIPSVPIYGLTTADGAVVVQQNPELEITLDNLMVLSNSVITASPAFGNVSILVLSNAVVDSNAAISVDSLGFNAGNPGPGAGEVATNGEGSGGGYGGAGGQSAGGAPGGATYGSAVEPNTNGSEGGVAFTEDPNLSQGGGVVNLEIGGTFTLNGKINADGNAGLFPGAGGGSGGSIWLAAGTITGQGLISAQGGTGQGNVGGGGGGGRIAIYARTNVFAGESMVTGGAGFASGQSGTLYLSTNLVGPHVIAQTPGAIAKPLINTVELTFDSPLDPISVPQASLSITTPSGSLNPSDVIAAASGANLTLSFPPQTTVGNYSVQIQSGIQNIYGLAMVEPYNGDFSILPPSVALVSSVGTNGASLNLQWFGTGGISYQVEFSQDLNHWQPYGSPISSSNGLNSLVLPIALDSGTFFRLVLTN